MGHASSICKKYKKITYLTHICRSIPDDIKYLIYRQLVKLSNIELMKYTDSILAIQDDEFSNRFYKTPKYIDSIKYHRWYELGAKYFIGIYWCILCEKCISAIFNHPDILVVCYSSIYQDKEKYDRYNIIYCLECFNNHYMIE